MRFLFTKKKSKSEEEEPEVDVWNTPKMKAALADPKVRAAQYEMDRHRTNSSKIRFGETITLGRIFSLKKDETLLNELSADGDQKSISVKVSMPTDNKAAAQDKAKSKSKPKSKGTSPGDERKMMRDLLKHHDEAFIFHRQKSAEHAAFVDYHGKMKGDAKHRILSMLNKKAVEHHDGLRSIYRKIGDQAYSMLKPKEKDDKNNKKPTKAQGKKK